MSEAGSPLAPVALFAFRRAGPTLRVLDALARSPGFDATTVHIFSDGPRHAGDLADVAEVRRALAGRPEPNLRVIEREHNLGLAASVIAGVGELVERHGRVIVLEDDLVPEPGFLLWMNRALDRYSADLRVVQIASYMFAVPAIAREGRSVFFRHPSSKGWGVWRRSWQEFDPDCVGWQTAIADPEFRARFRVGGAMRFEDMLEQQMAGRLSSWAIRFHFHVVKGNGLVLYPPRSFVSDVGLQAGKSTHGQRTSRLLPPAPVWHEPELPAFPPAVVPDDWAIEAWARRLRRSPYGAASALASLRYRLLDRQKSAR